MGRGAEEASFYYFQCSVFNSHNGERVYNHSHPCLAQLLSVAIWMQK